MIDENNTLFNNFVETVERYELLSQTQRLIFCFSGGKDATIGLHFLRKYLEENNIGIKLHVIMVLFPKHVYFAANNEHIELDRVIEYWKSLEINIDVLQVSREDIDLSKPNPCKFCKKARKEKIDKYLSANEYANDSSTLVTGYTLYDAIAYTSEICLRSNFFNSYTNNDGSRPASRCSVPHCREEGYELRCKEKEALWDRYYTAAPAQQRQCVERYKIVKRA